MAPCTLCLRSFASPLLHLALSSQPSAALTAAAPALRTGCGFATSGGKRRAAVTARASEGASAGDSSSSSDGKEQKDEEAEQLTAEFMRHVAATQQQWPLADRHPTALLPPTAVVRTQMDALMRNDWPEPDSGVQTAFNFAMPHQVNQILPGKARPPVKEARAWDAAERYLSVDGFASLLRDPMYAPLLNCDTWEFASPMTFHGKGDNQALQAVKVCAAPSALAPSSPSSASAADAVGIGSSLSGATAASDLCSRTREYTYTFCLQKVKEGVFKGCWMVVGLRVGDYANV